MTLFWIDPDVEGYSELTEMMKDIPDVPEKLNTAPDQLF